jgi:transposase-like protein
MLERLNEEIKRRTLVVRIFPNTASCLRLVRALAVEMHENWIEATRYLNMQLLKRSKFQLLPTRSSHPDGLGHIYRG